MTDRTPNCFGFALWKAGLYEKEQHVDPAQLEKDFERLQEVSKDEGDIIGVWLDNICLHMAIMLKDKPGFVMQRAMSGEPITTASFTDAIEKTHGTHEEYEGIVYKYYKKK